MLKKNWKNHTQHEVKKVVALVKQILKKIQRVLKEEDLPQHQLTLLDWIHDWCQPA